MTPPCFVVEAEHARREQQDRVALQVATGLSYELHVGDERRTVSAGASAILPRNIPHGFRNLASTPSRLV